MATKLRTFRLDDEAWERWQAGAADRGYVSVTDLIIGAVEHELSSEMVFRTRSGRVLTDEDIQKLADEAERGYDPKEFKKRPLPVRVHPPGRDLDYDVTPRWKPGTEPKKK